MDQNTVLFSRLIFHILELSEDSFIDALTISDEHTYIKWLCGSLLDIINPAREEDIRILNKIKRVLE